MSKTLRMAVISITAGILSLFAVLMGLIFMGVLPSRNGAVRTEESATGQESLDTADEDERGELWEINFRGMKITMQENGLAYIHESGCLNIRAEDAYLIQIDVEEDTVDNMWSRIDKKVESLAAAGYRIEQSPERITEGERDYVRYVISIDGERGADYERIYSEVCLAPADSGRHFLIVVRYDGTDMEALDEEARIRMYEMAFADVEAILADAEPTDEPDDEAGSYWMVEENIDPDNAYSSSDSMTYDDGNLTLTYRLPENCYLISDNIAGKTYFDEENRIYINVSVIKYMWESAEDKADKHDSARFSRIHTQGQTEVNDRTFYYYTYSVLERSKTEKKYHYYFYAFCDLNNGDIYAIYGSADDNPLAMDETFYLDVMDISE